MIENVGDAEKMSGKLLTEIVDKILTEISGPEGGWGYVKSDNDETNTIKNEEIIDEKIKQNEKTNSDIEEKKEEKEETFWGKIINYFKNYYLKITKILF
uniref:Uncharacterized protein n=1 Tax=Meloidogyne hapla TaxID=6305 RepID=A0A1I8BKG5_MELHA